MLIVNGCSCGMLDTWVSYHSNTDLHVLRVTTSLIKTCKVCSACIVSHRWCFSLVAGPFILPLQIIHSIPVGGWFEAASTGELLDVADGENLSTNLRTTNTTLLRSLSVSWDACLYVCVRI